jgi:hypothetical protein
MRPFRKFIQNNTIITNQRNLFVLRFAVAPILGHPLFEHPNGWILFTNVQFVRDFFENGDAFLDAIAHRFFDLGHGFAETRGPTS